MFEHTSLQEDRFGYHATGKERFIGFLKGLLVMLAAIVGIAIVGSLITWLFKLIGLVEIGAVVSILLLFAAILAVYPLLIVASTRYQLSRTSFREARFRFTGKPMELAKIYAKGIFLSLITFGIYGAWFHVELQNYMMKNTAYGPARFEYNGKGMDIFFIHLWGIIRTILTAGIYGSWYIAEVTRYEYNHTKFNGIQMASDLKGFAFFIKYLLFIVMVIFSGGIATPWAIVMMNKLVIESISLESLPQFSTEVMETDGSSSALADGVADAGNFLDSIAGWIG